MGRSLCWTAWWALAILQCVSRRTHAFVRSTTMGSSSMAARQAATSSALHCICIDCARVTNCAAYHFVETKHEQPHMNENPTFEPVNGRYASACCEQCSCLETQKLNGPFFSQTCFNSYDVFMYVCLTTSHTQQQSHNSRQCPYDSFRTGPSSRSGTHVA